MAQGKFEKLKNSKVENYSDFQIFSFASFI